MNKILCVLAILGSTSANATSTFGMSESFVGDAASIQAVKDLKDFRGTVVAKKGSFVRVANDAFSIKQFCILKGYDKVTYADITNRGTMPERNGTSVIGLKIDVNSGEQSIVAYYDPYILTVKAIVCGNR